MKIATYNMAHRDTKKSWSQLIGAFNPDLILAQETHQPDRDRTIWERHREDLKWGSSIYAKHGELKPIKLRVSDRWMIGAEISGSGWNDDVGNPLFVFNIHAPGTFTVGELTRRGYIKAINHALDIISEIVSKDMYSNLVVGGDFNLGMVHNLETSANARDQVNQIALIKRLESDFSLASAWSMAHPSEGLPQTLRFTGKEEFRLPFHCDFIFVPKSWRGRVQGCDVLSTGEWLTNSDHIPLVATFN